jgi:alpha-glucosidase
MTETAIADVTGRGWWRHAVIYQVYPRSWADADGDGLGDLPGITARLPYLADLGVDAVWLSPFYPSPQHDAGYDVSDYRDVDPRFGTLADADALVAEAHGLGIRVVVDIVPNHSSSEHAWFREALASPPGSAARARYLFRDGKGADGSVPPNNWQSVFGGPAWERVDDGQYYLHLFDVSQPDFDWTNPEVGDEMERTLRFWFDRGVDGFRVDVANGLVKAPGLPDVEPGAATDLARPTPMWNQPGVHEVYRRWRRVGDSYDVAGEDADRVFCAEAWVSPASAAAEYVRPDELQQCFNFGFLLTPWIAGELRASITESLAAVAPYDAAQTWVLSNHDVVRHASRLGYPPQRGAVGAMPGIGIDDPQPDAALGLRRARAATTMMLALPGSAYLYQGEELGLPEATRLPDAVRQDPTWERSGHRNRGRDGCRVPFPWEGGAPSYGFGPSDRSWLPQPEEYGELAVDRQTGHKASTLELYRDLLKLRRAHQLGLGRLTWVEGLADSVVGFEVTAHDGGAVRVLANVGGEPQALPEGFAVIASSIPEEEWVSDALPTDAAVWLRSSP